MIRYRTGDITTLYHDRAGKRRLVKMGPIIGRADDMLIIRGVNLFHTQVEAQLHDIPAFSATPPGSIPRSEGGKLNRILDLRKHQK